MNFNMQDVLASRWMAKEDVPEGTGVDLQMRSVSHETVGDDQAEKYALHFHGSYKPLLLNKTNVRVIVALYGADSGRWVNQPINVYCDPLVGYGGRLTGGVRVRAAQAAQNRPRVPAVPAAPAGWPQGKPMPQASTPAHDPSMQGSMGSGFDDMQGDTPWDTGTR